MIFCKNISSKGGDCRTATVCDGDSKGQLSLICKIPSPDNLFNTPPVSDRANPADRRGAARSLLIDAIRVGNRAEGAGHMRSGEARFFPPERGYFLSSRRQINKAKLAAPLGIQATRPG